MLEVINPTPSLLTTPQAIKDELNKPTLNETWLTTVIMEQSDRIERYCSRVFGRQSYRQTTRMSRPYDEFVLMGWPVASLTLFSENGIVLSDSQYELDKDTGYMTRLAGDLQIDWPAGKYVAEFTAGYLLPGTVGANLPPSIERACKELAKGAVYAQTRDPQLKSLILPGVVEEVYFIGNPNGASLPVDVTGMIQPFRNIHG